MSSTTNLQNLLANIIRPVYVYDAATSNYTTKVIISNVEAFWGNSIYVGNLTFGDSNNNLYIGSNAGAPVTSGSYNNVGFGWGAAQNNSNVRNSVFVGYLAGGPNIADASASVVLGANTYSGGSSNIYIGYGTGSVSNASTGNIFVGTALTSPTAVSNQVRIGNGSTVPLSADMNTGRVGINTAAPEFPLDVSGQLAYFRGKVGIQCESIPSATLTVNGRTETGSIATEDGSIISPAYTFTNDLSLGWYRDASAVHFASNGMNVIDILKTGYVDISGIVRASAFIGTSSGGGSGGVIFSNGSVQTTDGIVSVPTHTFQSDLSTGMFLPSVGVLAFSAAGVNGLLLSNSRVGIGGISAPAYPLDVSGTTQTSNLLVSGYLRNALIPTQFDISGGNISNSGVHRATGLIGTYLRDASLTLLDISGGNIRNAGTTTSSNFVTPTASSNSIGGVTLSGNTINNTVTLTSSNVLVNGYLRNALIPTQFDISTGNISNSATHTSSNFVTLTASSNTIGGVVLNASNVSNVSTVSSSNVLANGYLRNALIPTQFDISSGNISNSATHTSSNFVTSTASSNTIGGVVLNASNISNISTVSSSNVLVNGYLRNALIPTQFDISSGNISNSGVHTTTGLVATYLRDVSLTRLDISGGNIRNSGIVSTSTLRVSGGAAGESVDQFSYSAVELGRGDNDSGGTLRSSVSFQYYDGGGLRHFLRTRHDAAQGNGNAIDLFTCSGSAGASTQPGSGNALSLSVTGGGVGISNARPAYPLDVSSTANTITAQFRNRSGQSSVRVTGGAFNDASGLSLYHTSAEQGLSNNNVLPFHIWTSNARRMTVLSNGDIGIGTTIPTWPVDISRTADYQIRVTGGGLYSGMLFTKAGTDACGGAIIYDAAGKFILRTTGGAAMTFENPANTERMRILSNGDVGIGTTDPTTVLDVRDVSATIRICDTANRGPGLELNRNNGVAFGTSSFPDWRVQATSSGGNYQIVRANTTNGTFIPFHVEGATTNTGINTTTPQYTLDVSGNSRVYGGGMFVTSNNSLTAPSGMRMVVQGGDSYIQYGSDTTANGTGTGSLRITSINATNTAVVVSSNSTVGIGKAPAVGYALDISGVPNTASINMTSWPRTTAAVSYYGVYSSTSGSSIVWTTSNSIDSNIITVGSNTGTHFVVKKSGIYSISAVYSGATAGTPYSWIDCSTNSAHDGANSVQMPQLAYVLGNSANGQFSIGYVGFLPSNVNIYYKIKISAITPSAGRDGARLTISFLGETPTVTGFPF